MIEMLAKNNAESHGYLDIANKLNLLRHGYIFKHGVLQDLASDADPVLDYQKPENTSSIKLFQDA